jgi:hypothetical protein
MPQRCSFEDKVANAQAAGAAAAIIFDYVDEGLLRMKSSGSKTITIPSVFVSLDTGTRIMEMMAQSAAGALVALDATDPYPILFDGLNLTMLGLVVGLLIVVLSESSCGECPPALAASDLRDLSAVCGILYLCSSARARGRPAAHKSDEVLTMDDVLALPRES